MLKLSGGIAMSDSPGSNLFDQLNVMNEKLCILESLVRGAVCFIQEYEDVTSHIGDGLYYGFFDFKTQLESLLKNIE